MKKFIIFVFLLLFLAGCGVTYSSSPYYNLSVLNDNGIVVYHFPCVKVISQNVNNNTQTIIFKALDGKYYSIQSKSIILQETTYSAYRRSYYYYDMRPNFRYYPKHSGSRLIRPHKHRPR